MVWRSFHIFYYDNHDQLLRCGILPTVKKYNLGQFFFIRYWEQGPHIRLRIKTDDDGLIKKIIDDIEKYISLNRSVADISGEHYNDLSQVFAQKEKLESENWRQIVPNNTVCLKKYIPEIDKYHGEKGVEIAESEFCYSSILALNVLLKARKKSEKMLYGAAYALELADSVFKQNEKKLRFFKLYRRYWENFVEVTPKKKEQIKQIVSEVNCENIRKIEEIYAKSAGNFHKELFDKLGDDSKIQFDFLMNFVHLFNNRIGITPYEEIQTIFICQKLVEEVLCKSI